jgi:cyclopropane fatty-acyl-phospholipid synthase-like methyltransferase
MSEQEEDIDLQAYYHVAYGLHGIMNPLADERLIWIGALCGLDASSHVLDIGSGNGHASLVLTREFGCSVELVDVSEKWTALAVERFREAGLAGRANITCMDAAEYRIEPGRFNMIICLGTAQALGGFKDALKRVLPGLAAGGHVVIAEPSVDVTLPASFASYLRRSGWAIPSSRHYMRTLDHLNLEVSAVLRSTADEWDRYMSLQWKAIADHAREHPDDLEAVAFLDWMRDEQEMYLLRQRHYVQWDIYVVKERNV